MSYKAIMFRVLNKLLVAALLVLLALVLATTVFYVDIRRFAGRPAGPDNTDRLVAIRSGASLREVIDLLHRSHLIASPFRFGILARMNGVDKQIKAGEYMLSATMPPEAILERLVKGRVRLYPLTVPEGYTFVQIAALVERDHDIPARDFIRACTDGRLLDALNIRAGSVEGYLFPETYMFPRGVTPEVIVRAMVAGFRNTFKPEWETRAAETGFSVHEIITLASIIEKETGVCEERSMVSSVFHNRLKKGMRLDSDPTVIYGVENFAGRLTRKHLNTPTPYNTYRMRGLPPGPIANPGELSIRAALYPAETPYFYFVSRNDGSHHFSVTLNEHNRAVRKYQLGNP